MQRVRSFSTMKKIGLLAVAVLCIAAGALVTAAGSAQASTIRLSVATPTSSQEVQAPAPHSGPKTSATDTDAAAMLTAPTGCVPNRICFYAESLGRGAVNYVNTTGCQNFPANWNDAVTSIWNTYYDAGYRVALYWDAGCTGNPLWAIKYLYNLDDVQLNSEWQNGDNETDWNDNITSFKLYYCTTPLIC